MNALLECVGLTVRFGGLVALDALDLNVQPGEVLGLIGPNGSGKTTLFNAITGLYTPSAGRVRFAGQDLTGAAPRRIYRAGVARTFQRSRLCLTLSVFDNIMIGNHRRLDNSLLTNLLRRRRWGAQMRGAYAEARELLETFDPSLARRMHEPLSAFSMIARRRIEICRALINQPKLLLLDEPSAGMTQEETRALMDEIMTVRARLGELSIIIIEHEMSVIERVTERCIVLNFGKKICEGKYREVARDARVQEAYLGQEAA